MKTIIAKFKYLLWLGYIFMILIRTSIIITLHGVKNRKNLIFFFLNIGILPK